MCLAAATTRAGFGIFSTVDAEGEPDSVGYAFDALHRPGASVQGTLLGAALLATRRDDALPTVKTTLAARGAAGSAPEQTGLSEPFAASLASRGNAGQVTPSSLESASSR